MKSTKQFLVKNLKAKMVLALLCAAALLLGSLRLLSAYSASDCVEPVDSDNPLCFLAPTETFCEKWDHDPIPSNCSGSTVDVVCVASKVQGTLTTYHIRPPADGCDCSSDVWEDEGTTVALIPQAKSSDTICGEGG